MLAASAFAARPLEGTVRDLRTLLPVPHALVELVATGEVVQADAEGRFRFPSLPDGTYALCARRIGYDDRCDISATIGPEEFLNPVMYLSPRDLQGPVVVVTDSLKRPRAAGSLVITREEIAKSGAATVADVLERTPDVEILRESNGTSRVSIRGSHPGGVKVLVDGVPLASSGQAVDLASISASDIESIEILKGPSVALAGADALAGAVLITTREAASSAGGSARAGVGSFNYREGSAQLDGLGVGSQRFGAAISRLRSDGDFTYYDDQSQRDTARENNDSFRDSWSARGNGAFARAWRWSAGINGYQLRAGVPGLEYELTPLADREQERTSGQARLEFHPGDLRAFASYSSTQDWNHYLNTGSLPYDVEQDAHWDLWRAGGEWAAGGLKQLSVEGEITQEELSGTDHRIPARSFGAASRESWALVAEWAPTVSLASSGRTGAWARLAYRYDHMNTEASYPQTPISPVIDPPQPVWKIGSPYYSGGVKGLLGRAEWSVLASYGRAFRRPPLLEQFWVESYRSRGNPGLKPERSEQFEIGYTLATAAPSVLRFEQRFYWSDVEDLIYWRTGQGGAWTPDNIGSARIDGRDETVTFAPVPDRISFRLNHLYSDHENTAGEPNTDGQPLPLRYRHKLTAGATGDAGWGWLDFSYRRFDRRYLREAGTASKSLEPYGVVDAVSGLRTRRWGVSAELVFRALNLTDARYEVIEREPMPGRNLSLSANFSTSIN